MYKMKQKSLQNRIKRTKLKYWKRMNSKHNNKFKAISLLFCYCIYLFRSDSLSLTSNNFKELYCLIFASEEFQVIGSLIFDRSFGIRCFRDGNEIFVSMVGARNSYGNSTNFSHVVV